MKYEYKIAIPEDGGKYLRRPVMEIEIFGPKGKIRELALVDSGADRSLFNVEVAELLGIDLRRAKTRRTIGISGTTSVFIAEIEIKVEHLPAKIKIPVGFIDSPYVSALLGEEGFFDQHHIKFEKDHSIFEITPVMNR